MPIAGTSGMWSREARGDRREAKQLAKESQGVRFKPSPDDAGSTTPSVESRTLDAYHERAWTLGDRWRFSRAGIRMHAPLERYLVA